MRLDYNKKMIPRAKEMRKNMTRQERKLWYEFLREYPRRFQRQKTIGSYITDFYCHDAGLIVELDGSQHYEERERAYDAVRTQFLEACGLCVLSIPNAQIDYDFAAACGMIDEMVRVRLTRKTPSVTAVPCHLPQEGGELYPPDDEIEAEGLRNDADS